MTIYFSQLLYQILLGFTKPFDTPIKNHLAMVNEILCSTYLMMYLIASDFNENESLRADAGTGLLVIIFVYVALNFAFFMSSLMQSLIP